MPLHGDLFQSVHCRYYHVKVYALHFSLFVCVSDVLMFKLDLLLMSHKRCTTNRRNGGGHEHKSTMYVACFVANRSFYTG